MDRITFRIAVMGLIILLASISVGSHGQSSNIYSESAWQERDKWQKPELIIDQLGLEPGDHVADIGCHEGYMTVKLAGKVTAGGLVYAVDIGEYKLNRLRDNLKERDIQNVKVTEGESDDPKLPDDTMDAVLILDAYHEMSAHMIILQHIRSSLKSDGRLVIVEPIRESLRGKGRSEQESKHEIDLVYVKEDLQKAGFKIIKEQDPFIDRTEPKGDKLWLLVAIRED